MSKENIVKNEEEAQKNTIEIQKINSKDDIKKMFDEDFASNINYIYVNSLDKEIGFKEITVLQQKTLSRITVSNENRKDIVYDTQCQLINTTCQSEGFNIYSLTEFDRLKLLLSLYQANMFQNDITFTCKKCGYENKYKMNFDSVLRKLDDINLDPKEFSYENKNYKYTFKIGYPLVKTISDFYKSYYSKYKNQPKNLIKATDNMSNMEYVNLYIKSIIIENKKNKQKKMIDLECYKASDIEEIVSMFPQDILYADDGVLKFIVNNYISVINDSFEKHTCTNCGHTNEEGEVNSAESFL